MRLLSFAALYAGVNILILLWLSVMVMLGRRRHKIVLGDGGNDVFARTVRAHANAAEYIPAAIAGLVTLALFDPIPPVWLVHAAGISLTAGRIIHGLGLQARAYSAERVAGMSLTLLSYVLIGGGLIYCALNPPT